MGMEVYGITGPQVYGDGVKNTPRLDRTGALVTMNGGGRWQELARLGLMFTGSTAAAGVNIPISTSTTQQFVLYNPVGNTKAAVLKASYLGYVSGTPVIGHTCYVVQNLGVAASTAVEVVVARLPVAPCS